VYRPSEYAVSVEKESFMSSCVSCDMMIEITICGMWRVKVQWQPRMEIKRALLQYDRRDT